MTYIGAFRDLTELTGKLIILKPVQPCMDVELFRATKESRKELYRFMPWENRNLEDVSSFIERATLQHDSGMQLHLAIQVKRTGEIVGIIGLINLDPFTPKGEIGYWISSSMTGRGYATDAVRTLLEFCRDEMKLHRIDACVADENIASRKVLEKCGFSEEGFKKKSELCHEVWLDMKLYGKILI
jgi:RimJ/RimL family protein N-acetyltransferase